MRAEPRPVLDPVRSNAGHGPSAARAFDARKVAVLGLGYVGLPTGLAYRDKGFSVLGIDISQARIQSIEAERVDLGPPDRARLSAALGTSSWRMTTDAAHLSGAALVVVCVPTPVDEHLVPDLRALRAACATVVRHASAGQTIVLTSTSFVGTTRELLIDPLEARGLRAGRDIFVAFSPERIDPANERFTQDATPRVVGGATEECAQRAAIAVSSISPAVHLVSSPEAAEMTKLYENTFRAVNIAFANEMAAVAGALNVAIDEVVDAASTKPYGFMRFTAGPGVGGHCIPCDPRYLLWQLDAKRVPAPLIRQTMDAIAQRPRAIVDRIAEVLSDDGKPLRGSRVLVVGVAYKPGVEDVRGSPASEIIGDLRARGAIVEYHDPLVPIFSDAMGITMHSVSAPRPETYDLVLTHTLQPGFDTARLGNAPIVLDATYSMPAHQNRMLP